MKKDDKVHLQDALEAIELVNKHLEEKTFENFSQSELLRDAVLFRITILRNALGKVSDTMVNAHSEIPWREAISNRNFLIHDYGSINLEMLWKTCNEDLPKLKEPLQKILEELSIE